jgi:trans-aconitate methyltransferase
MHINSEDLRRITSFYQDSLNQFGEADARSVHWIDEHNQVVRFEVLLAVQDISHKKILDVGCGLGDLYKLIKEKNIETDYTGIDIIADFIRLAKEKYPQARFLKQDIFDIHKEQFDVVLASGALSFKVTDNNEYYKDMIKKMYELAKESVAFNMLDNATHIDDAIYAAYEPNEIVDFCKTFCDRVEVVTDYLPQDFTVYLYKK